MHLVVPKMEELISQPLLGLFKIRLLFQDCVRSQNFQSCEMSGIWETGDIVRNSKQTESGLILLPFKSIKVTISDNCNQSTPCQLRSFVTFRIFYSKQGQGGKCFLKMG